MMQNLEHTGDVSYVTGTSPGGDMSQGKGTYCVILIDDRMDPDHGGDGAMLSIMVLEPSSDLRVVYNRQVTPHTVSEICHARNIYACSYLLDKATCQGCRDSSCTSPGIVAAG